VVEAGKTADDIAVFHNINGSHPKAEREPVSIFIINEDSKEWIMYSNTVNKRNRASGLFGLLLAAALLLLGFSLLIPGNVSQAAGIISVTTTDDELNGDNDCSLREAIEAVNTGVTVDQQYNWGQPR
jgi:CSLREA domain-containing protein